MPESYTCPECSKPLQKVRQLGSSPLNREQWESQIVGNWFCEACKGTRGRTGFRYFWTSELQELEFEAIYEANDGCPDCSLVRGKCLSCESYDTKKQLDLALEFIKETDNSEAFREFCAYASENVDENNV